ncbi:MAG: hypothetical protein AAGP08_04035 [Pseudomonadota bacterium]
MLRAHMATYPAREAQMLKAVESIRHQVDRVFVVLNEYGAAPDALHAMDNVDPILPSEDHKDTGKFLPQADTDDEVFLVDDDMIFSPGYVAHMRDVAARTHERRAVFGLHASFMLHGFRRKGFDHRRIYNYRRAIKDCRVVDMVGTGTCYAHGRHLPPFSVMQEAVQFSDIRFALWCHRNDITRITLSRPEKLVQGQRTETTIYRTFTNKLPDAVFDEVKEFGRKDPRLRQVIPLHTSTPAALTHAAGSTELDDAAAQSSKI